MKTKQPEQYTEFALTTKVEPVVAWTVYQGETQAHPVIGRTNVYGTEHLCTEFPRDVQDDAEHVRRYQYVPAAPGWFAVMFEIVGRKSADIGFILLGEHLDRDFQGDGWLLGGNQYVVVAAASAADARRTPDAVVLRKAIEDILRARCPKATVADAKD